MPTSFPQTVARIPLTHKLGAPSEKMKQLFLKLKQQQQKKNPF